MFSNGAGAVQLNERGTLVARVGASQDQSNNNKWAQSPGAIAGFTIVFSIVAAGCVYLLWRGPNRRAFPCIKPRKASPQAPKDVEGNVFPDDYSARGPANWRDTIVRKEAFFPVPKGTAPSDSEKDYALHPQRTASLYSYDSKYTAVTTLNGAPSRNSRTSFQDHRASRASGSRRPPSLGAASALSIPELPEAAYLATQDHLFGLPVQTPQSQYQSPLPRSPASTAPQTDYFGPASPGLLSANSAYGRSPATSPPAAAAANRRSLVRKSVGSVGIPSPLAQSTISHETVQPQRPDLRKSRTVSFVDKPGSQPVSTSTPSPPRTQSRTSTRSAPSGQLPPGAGHPLEPVPPVPQFLRAGGADEAVPMAVPRVSWNGPGFTPDTGPSKPVEQFQLPDGAYPPTHPVALAHAKLSSASASPPSPSPSTFAPALPYATPPQSPPTKRVPTAPGYVSRFSRSPSASASPHVSQGGYAPEALSSPPLRGDEFSEEHLDSSTSGSRSGSASPPSSTPPTSVSHYSTPASSIAGHGARVVSGKKPGHKKGGSTSSSPSSSTSSRKRGLWFESADKPAPTGLGIATPPTVMAPARV